MAGFVGHPLASQGPQKMEVAGPFRICYIHIFFFKQDNIFKNRIIEQLRGAAYN